MWAADRTVWRGRSDHDEPLTTLFALSPWKVSQGWEPQLGNPTLFQSTERPQQAPECIGAKREALDKTLLLSIFGLHRRGAESFQRVSCRNFSLSSRSDSAAPPPPVGREHASMVCIHIPEGCIRKFISIE
jgi:hypothetical protein